MENKPKKIVLYVSEEDYKKLRIKLLELNKTVSGWFREKVTSFLQSA